MPLLKSDITSYRKTIYGMSGDQVRIVAEHGSVLIVEDSHKNRFPVARDQLADTVDEVPYVQKIYEPVAKEPAKKRARKNAGNNQAGLF